MIKKYNQYIKESINLDIDPYGEEDWDEDNLLSVLQIARRTGLPYDQITQLNCSNNQLTNLEGIENLTNLVYLSCWNNQLTSLEGIENLIDLEYLSCERNQLTSLDGIENLINLKYLYCQNNQLTSLEGIEKLTNLQIISCRDNQFSPKYIDYIKNYCNKKKIELYIYD